MNSITVSKLVFYLKSKLENDPNLGSVLVSGEISNFHRQFSSGHCYFVLKDENAQINCVMFKSNANKLNFEPKNGDKVIVNAKASIFESSGQLQLYVTTIKNDGLGDLFIKYEMLKKKLGDEGYFDDNHKKSLKSIYLDSVAVLVGDKSAAMSDIKTCFKRRWPLAKITYYPVLVQGQNASLNIIQTLKDIDSEKYDAIILARGGGSFEDLFCFNDEDLVKCIFNLKTFIVSGIGHEQDYTLVDFVSDLRAPTPTAAVELITPDINDVIDDINDLKSKLLNIIDYKRQNLSIMLDISMTKLNKFQDVILSYKNNIQGITKDLNHIIKTKLNTNINNIQRYKFESKQLIKNKLITAELNVKRFDALVKAYSCDKLLNKGYALVYKNGKLIKSVNDVANNDELKIRLYDGEIKSIVKEKKYV